MEIHAWKYHSDTGQIESPTGFKLGDGYSGNGAGLNNPAMESAQGHGPIPRGSWTIGPFHDDPHGKGPVVAHLAPPKAATPGRGDHHNEVDGHDVPVPHFGVVLDWDDFHALAARLREGGMKFVIEPYVRFQGLVGEQATMFFRDPSGNALEFKSFRDRSQLFAK